MALSNPTSIIALDDSIVPLNVCFLISLTLLKNMFIYLFLEREEGREKEREKHWCEREILNNCLSYVPRPGMEPATQPCALTRNWTILLHRTMPNQQSHTSQCLFDPRSLLLPLNHSDTQNIIFCSSLVYLLPVPKISWAFLLPVLLKGWLFRASYGSLSTLQINPVLTYHTSHLYV